MPLINYKVTYLSDGKEKEAEAYTLRKLSEITGIQYDKIQRRFRYGDNFVVPGILKTEKIIIKNIKRTPNIYYVKKRPDITYKITKTEEVEYPFNKLSQGAEILNVSVSKMCNILRSETERAKYNIVIVE
jgi:hypothetical protein